MSDGSDRAPIFIPSEKFSDLLVAHCLSHFPPQASVLDPDEIRMRIGEMLMRRIGTIWRQLKSEGKERIRIVERNSFIAEISSKITDNLPHPVKSDSEMNERNQLLSLLAEEFRDWVNNEAKKHPEYDFLKVASNGDIYIILKNH